MSNRLLYFIVALIFIAVGDIYAENIPIPRLTHIPINRDAVCCSGITRRNALVPIYIGTASITDIIHELFGIKDAPPPEADLPPAQDSGKKTTSDKQTEEQSTKEKALQQYRLKLKENTNDIETHRIYQNLMRESGRKDEVQKEYSAKLQTEPQNPLYHYLYGRLLEGKNLEDAFNKALELEKQSPNPILRFWIYYGLGQFYKDSQKYKEALQNLDAASKLKPDLLDIQHQMALVYYEMNNISDALNIWDKLLKIDANYIDARLGKGIVFKSKGDYDNAIKEFGNIITLYESYWKAYEPLIQCYHAKKDYQKGEQLRNKIRELYNKAVMCQELIVIDIINLKKAIIVVKEWLNTYHQLWESKPSLVAYSDYSFEIYKEGIDKKPDVVYTLYRVYKVPGISLESVRLERTEITKKNTEPKLELIQEYKTIPVYLELLTLIMNREKDK
ncbi:MAG: tetratricopeptide repeat protein [Planctomycetota bacterium]